MLTSRSYSYMDYGCDEGRLLPVSALLFPPPRCLELCAPRYFSLLLSSKFQKARNVWNWNKMFERGKKVWRCGVRYLRIKMKPYRFHREQQPDSNSRGVFTTQWLPIVWEQRTEQQALDMKGSFNLATSFLITGICQVIHVFFNYYSSISSYKETEIWL